MGKVTGFLEIDRHDRKYKPAADRIRNYKEFVIPLGDTETKNQAARCMDCGIPFCHTGCPVNNQIPDWNDLVYSGNWEQASANLHSTNNFPEFTGRICPAPCEASCTLNITDESVTIKTIECAIVDKAWQNGWIKPMVSTEKTGKNIAIIGSGPAGLAAAQQLARQGHSVDVYEKNSKAGGLLRYGIPDFKMEKHHIDRRVEQMQAEGVNFHFEKNIGVDLSMADIEKNYDAIILSGGSEKPRDLPIEGRDFSGIHFAMDFLPLQNKVISYEISENEKSITANGKHVVVIGGGDTGSDCIGTSFRQGALSVTQLEIMPEPPEKENKQMTWPYWPLKMRTSSSQAEGAMRDFSVLTESFEGSDGILKGLNCIRVDDNLKKIDNSAFKIKADLVLLAMGFVHPIHEGLLKQIGVTLNDRGNVQANEDDYMTNINKIFVAGDMRRGQSLVVWAIREGRQVAHSVDKYLMGQTNLPR
tara:strand:+ start:20571 stop:21989 length:1419 start_codon:yes stop_codon:yes gene_type:complete